MKTALPLRRQGASLLAPQNRWEMLDVQGPFGDPQEGRQYFRISTSARQTLLVYREAGERGMRLLFLLAVMEARHTEEESARAQNGQ